MSALTVDATVVDGKLHIVDESFYRTRLARAVKQWGSGAAIRIRIEPEDEAYAYGALKFLFGYVFEPVCQFTGYTKQEVCLMCKAEFMPDGKTSLTELNREEMDAFSKASEQWLREECWEAFERYGREYVA